MEKRIFTDQTTNRRKITILEQKANVITADIELDESAADKNGTPITASLMNEFQEEIIRAGNNSDLAVSNSTSAISEANSAKETANNATLIAENAKTISEQTKTIAETANTTAEQSNSIAREALETAVSSAGTKVTQNGVALSTFESNTKVDKTSFDTFSNTAFKYRGQYNAETTYNKNDVVKYNYQLHTSQSTVKDSSYGTYISLVDNNTSIPSTENWAFLSDLTEYAQYAYRSKTQDFTDNSDYIATTAWIKNYICPTGTVMAYAGTAIPNGWLPCNGSHLSRTTYAALFNAIGIAFALESDYNHDDKGNRTTLKDTTKFRLPDLRDRFVEGAGKNAVGISLAAGLPNITGWFGGEGWKNFNQSGCFSQGGWQSDWGAGHAKGNSSFAWDFNANNGARNATKDDNLEIYKNDCKTVQPPAVVMNYIIKY